MNNNNNFDFFNRLSSAIFGAIISAYGWIHILKICATFFIGLFYALAEDDSLSWAIQELAYELTAETIIAQLFIYGIIAVVGSVILKGATVNLPNNTVNSAPQKNVEANRNVVADKWICSKCNAENKMSSRFCYKCGNKSEALPQNNKTAGPNEWKCPKCGRVNQNYVGTCGCGMNKPT